MMSKKQVTGWLNGIQLLRLGCQDMISPKIRLLVILPLLINIIIFGALFYFGFQYTIHKLSFLSDFNLPHWLAWLQGVVTLFRYVIAAVVFIALFVIFSLLATFGANLLACPFNGLLSATFSKQLGQSVPAAPSLGTLSYQMFAREFKKLRYYLPKAILVGLACFGLQFVPPLNLLTPFIGYGFSAWIMAIQYIDYPADNYHMSFKNLLEKMKSQPSLCLGFGLGVALISTIPIVNLLVMPAAVLGATRLWHILNK